MTSIRRRIERIERRVGVKEQPLSVLIIGVDYDETAPYFPEPGNEWPTFKAALAETRRLRQSVCLFYADPWSEYETRNGLERGTLAKHEFCGKVPFTELLAVATGWTPDQGE